MAKIAIIGTGISGLSAAYLLNEQHDITIYEKEPVIGGHTRTLTVRYGERTIPVDTGFIVYNERNYPNLTALFRHLGVVTKASDMSFALTVCDGRLEWGAQSVNAIFGQRRNLVRPEFYRLFREAMRFNAKAVSTANQNPSLSLGQLITHMGLSDAFRRYYLLPMAGAIWSCPPRQMLEFPAETFVRFFANHGLLAASGQPQWRTVSGGAQNYVERLTTFFKTRIRTNCAVSRVTRKDNTVEIVDQYGHCEKFDEVVFASHSDETLKTLTDATAAEREALGAIGYQRNRVILHKDPQFMPKQKRCWASWVYHSDGTGDEAAITVSYWMNRLQSIDQRYPLFVTLNPAREIPQEHIFDEHEFHHPVFDRAALVAQEQLKLMQGRNRTWFCGAYLGHGFHEDGMVSAINVAEQLGTTVPWHTQSVVALARRKRGAAAVLSPVAQPAGLIAD
jgi:predicted NAD/FAD-binding protein